jgi:glycine C-acetyltransferase
VQVVQEYVQRWYESGLEPDEYIVHGRSGNRVDLQTPSGERRNVLTFCTNDVLGLTQHERVKQAAIQAIMDYGTSNSSTSVLSGRIDLHRQLEEEVSKFKHLPHTQLFLNAWMAMPALMDAFCHLAIPVPGFEHSRETLIMTDVLNHGCIMAALANAGTRSGKLFGYSPTVRVKAYRHCDMEDFAKKLKRYAKAGDRILVVSDAVFSMDGDVAPLPEMIEILSNYPDSTLVMDEAHASGSIGKTGRGIYEHFGLTPQDAIDRGVNPVIMTTFSKFGASVGAAISSHVPELIPLLNVSPTSIGTCSLAPALTAAALEAVRIVQDEPGIVAQLQANTKYMRSQLAAHGFEAIGETNVVPIMLPPDVNPKEFAQELLNQGVWASAIWFIAKPRIRTTVTSIHTKADMDCLVATMVKVRDQLLCKKTTISA